MTESSKMRDELKEELKRFRKLFTEAFDAIIVFSIEGSIIDVNDYAQQLTGYSRQELLKMSAFDLRPPEERERVQGILSSLAQVGFVRNISDTHFKRKDGTLIPVEINAKVIKVNKQTFILSIARDITERIGIEEELRERNENLEILNAVALEITSRLDLRDILTRVVENAVEIVGGDTGAIGFYDEREEAITYPYVYNVPRSLEKVIIAKGGGLAGYVIENKKPVIVENYPAYERSIREFVEAGVKSVALVPLLSKGTAFGVLGVFSIAPNKRFNKRGLWLLEGIGRQAAVAVENARLFERVKESEARLRDQNRNLQILSRMALEITSGLELKKFLPTIVRRTIQLADADVGAIGLYDKKTDTLAYQHVYRLPDSLMKVRIKTGEGVTGDVIKTKRPILINDCLSYPRASVELLDCRVRSVIVAPLMVEDRLIGTLMVGHLSDVRKFSGNDLTLIEAVGRQAAIAIENSRLFEETKERARRSEAANQISRIFSSTLELSEVLHLVINEISRAIGTEAGGIFFYQPNEDKFYGQMGYGPAHERVRDIVEEARTFRLAADAVKTKEPVLIKDAKVDPRIPFKYVDIFGLRSVLTLPLIVKDKVSGVIALAHTDLEHEFDEDQIEFAKSVALQAAIAIENARLYDRSRQSAKEAGLLLEATDTLTSALDLREVLQRLGRVATVITGLTRGSIQFYEPETEEIRFVASIGQPNFEVSTGISLSDMGDPLSSIYEQKRTVVIDDFYKNTPLKDFASKLDIKSMLGVPIVLRDEIIGGLFLDIPGERVSFAPSQIRLAEAIAREAALAISNARLYERIKDAYERERYVADVLQRSFLPERLPQIPNTDLAVFYASASEVARIGGDFYDFIDLSGSLIGLAIGDVSGKGIEAASTTALAKYTVRSFSYQAKHASTTVELANKVISRDIEPGTFITLIYAVYDWQSGRVLIANAGHPHPIHYAADYGKAHLVENLNAAFGVLPELIYSEAVDRLAGGDLLVLYTDGLIEARRGSEFYGTERLMQVIEENAGLSAENIVARIIDDVNAFARGQLTDDIALSVLKRKTAS
ncbi:MAG: GAF domain-containing protein [Actinobacteria bacterium]|nr:GAF domain-containing protein [Actinomycetota bacterium]